MVGGQEESSGNTFWEGTTAPDMPHSAAMWCTELELPLWCAGWVPYYHCSADFCCNVGGGCWNSGEVSCGEKWWRDAKECSVHSGWKGMYGLPAAKCRKECRLGTGGGQVKRRQGKSFFFIFFFLISRCLLFGICCCVHIQRGRVGIVPLLAQHGWVHSATACCPAKGQEVWLYPLGWKALRWPWEELSFGQGERERKRCGSP